MTPYAIGIQNNNLEGIWPGSYIAVNEIESFSRPLPPPLIDSISSFAIIVSLVIFFLFAYQRISHGISIVATSFLSTKKMNTLENQLDTQESRNTLFLFAVISSAFSFTYYNTSHNIIESGYPLIANYLFLLLIIGTFIIVRNIFFSLLSWVNYNGIFKTLNKFYHTYFILAVIITMLWFTAYIVFPDINLEKATLLTLVSVSIIFFLYIIRGYQLIISNGFSHFFYILYLCTLELLPILFFAHLLSK